MFARVQGRRGLDGTPGRPGEPGDQVWTNSRDIYGLLTKCEVTVLFSFLRAMDLDGVEVHKQTEKERSQNPGKLK